MSRNGGFSPTFAAVHEAALFHRFLWGIPGICQDISSQNFWTASGDMSWLLQPRLRHLLSARILCGQKQKVCFGQNPFPSPHGRNLFMCICCAGRICRSHWFCCARDVKACKSHFSLLFFFWRPPYEVLIDGFFDSWSFLGIWGFLRDHLGLQTEKKNEKRKRGKANFNTYP